jgi:hypothetical protein
LDMRYLFVSVLMFAVAVQIVQSQNTCDNPFADAGPLRFNVEYWDKTDFCLHSVPYSEILSGGPPPDGIPPIDDPQFESIAAADEWLSDQSPLIALTVDGTTRGYPLAILTYHEIVNDQFGDVPVAVTFCPLCNSALVFDRRVGEDVLRFGVSGNLRNSDMLMWDDLTQSWWQQLEGRAIVGQYTDTQLVILPSMVTSFGALSLEYPQAQILSRETGRTREYGTNPYLNYDSALEPFLFDGTLDLRLSPTAHVLGAELNGVAVAYPFDVLRQTRVINDMVGDIAVVAMFQDGVVSALDAEVIDESREIGTASLYYRVVGEQTLTFYVDEQGNLRDQETESTWNTFGRATAGPLQGTQLLQQVSGPFFWFAWAAFKPDTRIYGQE